MKKAQDILNSLIKNYSPTEGETYHSFFRSWAKVAGQDAAAHSKVEDIKGSVVVIQVDHPGWIQMIQMKKKPILKKIQNLYPELGITDLRFHLYRKDDLGL